MKRLSPLLLTACFLIGACSYFDSEPEEKRLPGERISILDLQTGLTSDTASDPSTLSINPPPVLNNEDWPQAGGYPHHAMQNLALGHTEEGALERIWRSDIGSGSSKKIPLNAQPIVAAGKVFTLDTKHEIRAFDSQTGTLLWQQDITNPREKDEVITGALSYAGGVIFATSGYGEILALNPEDGQIYWRTKITAGSRAAPTIKNGRVFVTTMNNNAIALDASNGQILWEHEGTGETTGLLGAASPAVDDQIIVSAFSTGDLIALRVSNGSVVWEDSLSNSLRLGGLAGLSDIRGLPVITQDRVIAVSFGNKMAAFDKNNGARLWQRDIGSGETPWVSGNTVYVLTPDSKILALDITNGDIAWVSQLAKYGNAKSMKDPLVWTAPIMVNGKLLLAGTGGRVIELDALSGKETKRWDVGDTISLPPIVASKTLFILTDDGTLSAYR